MCGEQNLLAPDDCVCEADARPTDVARAREQIKRRTDFVENPTQGREK